MDDPTAVYKCVRVGCDFEGPKSSAIHHVKREHAPLHTVPFYCSLCGYRCFNMRQLQSHVTNWRYHKVLSRGTEEDDVKSLCVSSTPYKVTFGPVNDGKIDLLVYQPSQARLVTTGPQNFQQQQQQLGNIRFSANSNIPASTSRVQGGITQPQNVFNTLQPAQASGGAVVPPWGSGIMVQAGQQQAQLQAGMMPQGFQNAAMANMTQQQQQQTQANMMGLLANQQLLAQAGLVANPGLGLQVPFAGPGILGPGPIRGQLSQVYQNMGQTGLGQANVQYSPGTSNNHNKSSSSNQGNQSRDSRSGNKRSHDRPRSDSRDRRDQSKDRKKFGDNKDNRRDSRKDDRNDDRKGNRNNDRSVERRDFGKAGQRNNRNDDRNVDDEYEDEINFDERGNKNTGRQTDNKFGNNRNLNQRGNKNFNRRSDDDQNLEQRGNKNVGQNMNRGTDDRFFDDRKGNRRDELKNEQNNDRRGNMKGNKFGNRGDKFDNRKDNKQAGGISGDRKKQFGRRDNSDTDSMKRGATGNSQDMRNRGDSRDRKGNQGNRRYWDGDSDTQSSPDKNRSKGKHPARETPSKKSRIEDPEIDTDGNETYEFIEEEIPAWLRCSPSDLYFSRDNKMFKDTTLVYACLGGRDLHVGLDCDEFHLVPGAIVSQLTVEALQRVSLIEGHKTVYFIAGIPDLLTTLTSPGYEETIFEDRNLFDTFYGQMRQTDMAMKLHNCHVVFSTISSMSLRDYNENNKKIGKTYTLRFENEYPAMQEKLHKLLKQLNSTIMNINTRQKLLTPLVHSHINKRSAEKNKIVYRLNMLLDGLNPCGTIVDGWRNTLNKTILRNKVMMSKPDFQWKM